MKTQGAEIAGRIRGLTAGQGDFTALAEMLDVHETALRISLDQIAPFPTLEVIAAVVARYGVDPCWLLTGEYNPELHRKTLEARTDELPAAIQAFVQSSQQPDIHPFRSSALRLEA